jgi:hypothetical protein
MRTCASVISGLLLFAAGAAAQGQTQTATSATQLKAPAVEVMSAPTSRTDLGPRTLSPEIVACTDLPTTTTPNTTYRILSSQTGDNHRQYAVGELVVLNGGTPKGYMIGQRFYVRRLQSGLMGEAPSQDTPGNIRTAGWITVVAADENFALARVDFACDAVLAEDYLEPFVETTLPAHVAETAPTNFTDLGKVLFGTDRRESFGAGDLANIDRGKTHGFAVGTRVGFYRDRVTGTPLVEMGEGVVVEVAAETAKVVLTRTTDAVMVGDYVAVRGVPRP